MDVEKLLEHPYVQQLHDIIADLDLKLEALNAEIRKLRKTPKKPKIKPSNLDKPAQNQKNDKNTDNTKPKEQTKRPGSEKRSKTNDLRIDEHKYVKLDSILDNWKFIGYRDYIVQGIQINNYNICYKREIWQDSQGKQVIAPLPENIQGTHFSAELRSYILYQYNQCHVTQPLLLEQLREFGIDISSGQLSNILTERLEDFHQEVDDILSTGLKLFQEIRTDDTSAPHRGKTGYCNCINTDLFTYFKSSDSKSRINFLEILALRNPVYILNQETYFHLQKSGLSKKYFSLFEFSEDLRFYNSNTWNKYLSDRGIYKDVKPHVYRKLTESALISGLITNGFNTDIVIHSDDAGQFKLFINSLCWKHAERPLLNLLCYTEYQREIKERKLSDFWLLYSDLKQYKLNPALFDKVELLKRFYKICEPIEKGFAQINPILEKLKSKEKELMLVLERPYTSLENNPSERDIREFAKRRKISGPTKNDAGRKARDTFASLKKTCRKLKISFWEYLNDRLSGRYQISHISTIITQKHLNLIEVPLSG